MIKTVKTTPFTCQKPGTSGLRKPTKKFQETNYTENFIAAILKNIETPNAHLVVGGDGRYFMPEAISKIIAQAAADKNVTKLTIGQNGLLSTPAASNLVRKLKATGAILLTASHNPGGPDNDFGIKFNCSNGGPAPGPVTDRIFENSKTLDSYLVADISVDLSVKKNHEFDVEGKNFVVEIIDSVDAYAEMFQMIFDFEKIKNLFTQGFKVRFDCMHAVNGPYAKRLLIEILGAPESSVVNSTPSPTFNNGHPDPNLTYAKSLVDFMKANPEYSLGVAFDGDGDRNMILGASGFFVTPSDSLALIAEHGNNCIPYFQAAGGIKGIARSMPTSSAADKVAKALDVENFEVPTGWKFFGSLMDEGKISLCGEESFGTGSDHIREKDGLWAAFAWLSILAEQYPHFAVKDLVEEHWKSFGRFYYSRWDYENLSSEQGSQIFNGLDEMSQNFEKETIYGDLSLTGIKNFSYTDLDGSVASKQGIIMTFAKNGVYHGRAIVRKSGTGSSGATIRLYLEKYDSTNIDSDVQAAVKSLRESADLISGISKISGRKEPTVIT